MHTVLMKSQIGSGHLLQSHLAVLTHYKTAVCVPIFHVTSDY